MGPRGGPGAVWLLCVYIGASSAFAPSIGLEGLRRGVVSRVLSDEEPPRPKLDALGERIRARKAANDFLEIAKNDNLITEEEATQTRQDLESPEAPEVPKERYSRFGDWFDVLSK